MDYVLYAYGFVGFAALYGAVWTAGGQRARQVLSLGAYAFHPAYVPPSRAWRRAQSSRRRTRNHAADFPSWRDYFASPADSQQHAESATPGIDAAPTVTLPVLVHAEMSADGTDAGAEHWGDLLRAMNTEERTVYSAELVATYEETKVHERTFLEGLDEVLTNFTNSMSALERREAAVFAGTWLNLVEQHGGPERWATGQYPVYETAV